MPGVRSSSGVSQKIPEINVRGVSTVIGTAVVTIYTCPTGKKALVKAAAIESNGGGANTAMDLRIETNTFYQIPLGNEDASVRIPSIIDQELDAGETINILGDDGANNGAAEFNFSIQETPA